MPRLRVVALLAVLVPLAFAATLPASRQSRLSYEVCDTEEPCASSLTCSEAPDKECSSTSRQCLCLPVSPTTCTSDSCTAAGEVCASTYFLKQRTTCAEKDVVGESPFLFKYSDPRPTPTPTPDGFSLSPCTKDEQCVGNRGCKSIYLFPLLPILDCNGEQPCVCLKPGNDIDFCVSSSNCEDGEMCAENPIFFRSWPMCMSAAETYHPAFRLVGKPKSPEGYTMDACTNSTQCLDDRVCVNLGSRRYDTPCKGENDSCICVPPDQQRYCDNGQTCKDGETCANSFLGDDRPFCVSSDIAKRLSGVEATPAQNTRPDSSDGKTELPSPDPVPEPRQAVCVDARLITGDRVFEKDIWAKVLCDEGESCATPGHIVVYQGNPLSMKRYCRQVGCREREMWVNSPTLRRGLRVRTNSNGLQFTALAARFETLAEEVLLAAMVRTGV